LGAFATTVAAKADIWIEDNMFGPIIHIKARSRNVIPKSFRIFLASKIGQGVAIAKLCRINGSLFTLIRRGDVYAAMKIGRLVRAYDVDKY